jgi:hypothetical protein
MNGARPNINRRGAGAIFAVLLVSAQLLGGAETNQTAGPSSVAIRVSPVESFRQMLAMTPAEQKSSLAVWPPELRQRVAEKLAEYQSMSPGEREMKLRSTEMRWFVRPLLSLPATNRAGQVAALPAALRSQATTRIAEWDRLPVASQQALLLNSNALAYFIRWDDTPRPLSDSDILKRKLFANLTRLVELPPGEKEKTLGEFSDDVKRRQMEQTLQAFEKLNPRQRERCLQSFTAFATMNDSERHEFFKNAERWSQMSSSEQAAWRELVSQSPIRPLSMPGPTGTGGSNHTNGGG